MTANEVRALLERARDEGLQTIASADDLAALQDAEVRVLGRKARLAEARRGLGRLSEDERKQLGRLANEVQQRLEGSLEDKRRSLAAVEREQRWQRDRLDVTLPGAGPGIGAIHPLTRTIWDIVDVFVGLGYRVADGPEIELSTYNFDALNTPPAHPSRAPTDTYYIAGSDEQLCLRTQTSPVQIRVMESRQPPVYVVAPGRVYRREDVDATHLSGFTQLEGLAVDEGITMGDLKGSLAAFAREMFGRDLDVRLRPHYFPFTEPSAEMDVQCFVCRGSAPPSAVTAPASPAGTIHPDPACRLCKGEGWIEILGCGMVHPAVLEWVGYDPQRFTGFAFGMGVERIASLAHGVPDIRYFWENDLRFLGHFAGAL